MVPGVIEGIPIGGFNPNTPDEDAAAVYEFAGGRLDRSARQSAVLHEDGTFELRNLSDNLRLTDDLNADGDAPCAGALREYCGGVDAVASRRARSRGARRISSGTRPRLYRNVCDETGAVRRHLNVFVNADNVRDLDGHRHDAEGRGCGHDPPAVSGG